MRILQLCELVGYIMMMFMLDIKRSIKTRAKGECWEWKDWEPINTPLSSVPIADFSS